MTSENKKANRLIHATSPYLLQHAHNPVDWFEWGTEALQKAREENKPILVSIGYSSCHWCHVMERESFENNSLASLMNEHYICVKVDREERPDVDHVYMEAVQAMGINGGWPLNVFLTPDQKPFYGGTYFPPQAWAQLLQNISTAWQTKRNEIQSSAEELTKIISTADNRHFNAASNTSLSESLGKIYGHFENKFDTTWGGLQKAPKFIMPSVWLLLLRYYHLTNSNAALQHINLTLTKILDGGIYDHAGGGFARYSVDAEWFVPHFEKMLYDNAQLISLYAEAFLVTQNPDYKRAVYETFDWLNREMTNAEGGFYSALDADSEGVEGKFYSWTKVELERVLGEDAALLVDYYGATDEGNWEHGQNILKRVYPENFFLKKHTLDENEWRDKLTTCKRKLLTARNERIPPALDDKILAGWNAMTICGLVDAYQAFDDGVLLEAARRNIQFIEDHVAEGERVYRSFKNQRSPVEGFLEDYAWLIKAYLKLYQADFTETWLNKSGVMMDYVIANFFDHEDGLFFFTSRSAEKLIARKKELFDNVIPASNSIMAMNLHHLGILLDRPEWKTMADQMISRLSKLIITEPNYMSNWGIAFAELQSTLAEVALIGMDAIHFKNKINRHYLPFSIFSGTETSSTLPLLKEKTALNNRTTIYVCRNYSCRQPMQEVEEAVHLILNKY
jgi:uncharacterized protein